MTRQEELTKLLIKANDAYYNSGREIMSDFEYDSLYAELLDIEAANGPLPGSPTLRPGIDTPADSRLKKVTHEKPALSLDKTKEITTLSSWLGKYPGALSWKMDGITIVATYEDGSLLRAVTRGNGLVGEDVTHNAKSFDGLPLDIPFSGKLTVRGEAVMTYREFNRINESLPEGEEPYKNPRNLAAGTIRLLEGIGDRKITFFAFDLVDATQEAENADGSFQLDLFGGGATEKNVAPGEYDRQMLFLEQQGINHVEFMPVTAETMEKTVLLFQNRIAQNDFPTDGLVLTYMDRVYGASLGSTGKHPRGSIAFKWQDELFETVIRDIEWSAAGTGVLTPVAVFDPVEIEQTTVSRASMHNVSIVKALKIGIGDKVGVYKANMIIPQIGENYTQSGNFLLPGTCPACGSPTQLRISDNGDRAVETLFCSNPQCSARRLGRYARFVSRDCMNIMGLSGETLRKFMDMGYIKCFSDIYSLPGHEETIKNMEGFGEKAVVNLLLSLDISKKDVEPWRFVNSLSIPGVGTDVSKKIMRHCGGDVEAFYNMLKNGEDFSQIDDIGPVISDALVAFGQNGEYMDDMARLMEIISFKAAKTDSSGKLLGKTVVITGSLVQFANREQFIAFVESHGGKVAGSVSKKTAYLVNNDVTSGSSKNKKARELGIPILSEEDFLKLVE